ncbi:MAG: hypothetical protein U5M23_12400 [Marinagarivorans sp.]|nr:hypothetical protein [Marinagarivorans sp.]
MNKLSALPLLITALAAPFLLSSCDRINNANRTIDTVLGGDYDVYIQGYPEVLHVKNGKVTSVSAQIIFDILRGSNKRGRSNIGGMGAS